MQISISCFLGDTIVQIQGDTLIEVLRKKSIIENLNQAILQEGMEVHEATPIVYETRDGYEYVGFYRYSDETRVTFGKTKEIPKDPDAQLFPKRKNNPNYTGFQNRFTPQENEGLE